jgi:hypothetical protein
LATADQHLCSGHPHSLIILLHDFIGQRWPPSVIAGCRTGRVTATTVTLCDGQDSTDL